MKTTKIINVIAMLLAMVLFVSGQFNLLDCILITITPLLTFAFILIIRNSFFAFEEFFNTVLNIFMF